MKRRPLGSSGIEASVVGLGTWVLGGGSVWGADTDDAESVCAVRAAIDEGIDLIDTAPGYGFGRSERVIGEAIRDRRDRVVLATKCGLIWGDEEARGSAFCTYDGRAIRRSLRPDTIREELEASLERLGTDRIDLYQTHWPAIDPDRTPIAETMGCLMELKREGKIRAIGVSNVTLAELEESCAAGEVAVAQLRYSMLTRGVEADILPFARSRGITLLAYQPLEQGLLTGKVRRDTQFTGSDVRSNAAWNPWFTPENRGRALDLLGGWKDLLEKYDTTLARLAIAWTFSQPGVTHVLCGARTAEQARENGAAGHLEIDSSDLDRMSREIEALGPAL